MSPLLAWLPSLVVWGGVAYLFLRFKNQFLKALSGRASEKGAEELREKVDSLTHAMAQLQEQAAELTLQLDDVSKRVLPEHLNQDR